MGAKNDSGLRTITRAGRKVFVIDFRYLNAEGVKDRYRKDAPVQNRAAAKAEAARLRRLAAETGRVESVAEVPTFEQFVRGTFTELVMVRLKPSTREGYHQLLFAKKDGLIALIGQKRLDMIGAADARMIEANALARGAKARYGQVCLRTVLREAVELDVLKVRPKLPRLPRRSEKLPDAPPVEHVVRMIEGSSGWLRVAIALAAFAGLRMGEMRALEVQDVDLVAGCLSVRRAYSADEIVMPKGLNEELIPLAPVLRLILAEAVANKKHGDRVVSFSRKLTNETPAEATVGNALHTLQTKLGIQPRRSYHKLRHFFATAILRGGANVETLRRLMRHKELASTTRYVHTTTGELDHAVTTLPALTQAG